MLIHSVQIHSENWLSITKALDLGVTKRNDWGHPLCVWGELWVAINLRKYANYFWPYVSRVPLGTMGTRKLSRGFASGHKLVIIFKPQQKKVIISISHRCTIESLDCLKQLNVN